MILAIARQAFTALRRDRGAFILSFVLPVVFFSIFAIIFGGRSNGGTSRISLLVVDQDQSPASRRLVRGLLQEPALAATTHPEPKKGGPAPADYTAVTAEDAVKKGAAPVAIVIPKGFGNEPVSFGSGERRPLVQLLHDSADPIAPQVVAGLLQKVVMTSMGDLMAAQGMKYFEQAAGGLTPQQRENVASGLSRLREVEQRREADAPSGGGRSDSTPLAGGLVDIQMRDVVGEKKESPMVAFYAAGIGVMFLLFTASSAGGSLLDEADSGALDRVLSSRVGMTTLLAGKMTYCTVLAFAQLCVMFLWGAAVFHLELFRHLPGFFVMGLATSFAVASLGMLLASVSRTRAQQGAVGTLLILTMSAVGGSMFPRFLMPEAIKKVGLLTLNAWAIDGFTKVFWRDEPVSQLAPQAGVLLGAGLALFFVARRFARRWERS